MLTCDPHCIVLPPIPHLTAVKIPLVLKATNLGVPLDIENAFYTNEIRKNASSCPFSIDFENGRGMFDGNLIRSSALKPNSGSAELKAILATEFDDRYEPPHAQQPIFLIFVAQSSKKKENFEACLAVPISVSPDDSLLSLHHYNSLNET